MDISTSGSENEQENDLDKNSTITEVEVETAGSSNKDVHQLNELVAHIRSGFRTREVKAATDVLSELQSTLLELMVERTKIRTQNTELKKQLTENKAARNVEAQRPAPTYASNGTNQRNKQAKD